MKSKYKITLFAVLCIFAVAFIFYNSAKPSAASDKDSLAIANALTQSSAESGGADIMQINTIIRKVAHVIEFAALGVLLSLFTSSISEVTGKRYICFPLLLGLCVAVADEFIQKFCGRSSKVSDVLIDFSGVILGTVVVLLLVGFLNRRLMSRRGGR